MLLAAGVSVAVLALGVGAISVLLQDSAPKPGSAGGGAAPLDNAPDWGTSHEPAEPLTAADPPPDTTDPGANAAATAVRARRSWRGSA